jgi:hypothetical protein
MHQYLVTGRSVDGAPKYWCIRLKDKRVLAVAWSDSMAIPDNFDDYFSKTCGEEKEP